MISPGKMPNNVVSRTEHAPGQTNLIKSPIQLAMKQVQLISPKHNRRKTAGELRAVRHALNSKSAVKAMSRLADSREIRNRRENDPSVSPTKDLAAMRL